MRAAVLQSPRQVRLADVPEPEPEAGEVRIRLSGAGVCASELPLWQGREWFEYPRPAGEPGHEGWGVVEAIGPDVSALSLGQRVAAISQRAHAEYDVAGAGAVVPIPDAIAGPFPGEPLACAFNAFRRAGVERSDRVAVVGCGFLGLLLVQLSAALAHEVVAISRRRSSLEFAESCGAGSTWLLDDRGVDQLEPFDVAFEVTGRQEPLDLASRLTRVRGTLVIAGYHQDGRRSIDMQLWNWRGLDVINAHERDPQVYAEGLRGAIEAVLDRRLDPAPLLTHSYALDEIGEAYRISCERPDGFVKAVWCER